jgi:hypothetical protein
MRIPREKKEEHSVTGKQIKIILSVIPADPSRKWDIAAWAGEIYTIIDRPHRKAKKNGQNGVWIEGIFGPVYAWFHEWEPFIPMVRTKYTMIRTNKALVRTKISSMKRTK